MKTRIQDPQSLRALFDHHETLRAVVDGVLEGRLGRAWVWREPGASPRVARLDLGCYGVFGGDPQAPGAEELMRDFAAWDFHGLFTHPPEVLPGIGAGWGEALTRVLGPMKEDPMTTFELAAPDRAALEERCRSLSEGYALVPFDRQLAAELDLDLAPHGMQAFGSAEAFLACGLGAAVVKRGGEDGSGRELACAATPYSIAEGRIELAIATHPRHRRRGLAGVASARLILDCLDRGLHPDWSASNPVSQRLARRLGYRAVGRCPSLELPATPAGSE